MWSSSQSWRDTEKQVLGKGFGTSSSGQALQGMWAGHLPSKNCSTQSSGCWRMSDGLAGSHALQGCGAASQRKTKAFLPEEGRWCWADENSRHVLHPEHIKTCWCHSQSETEKGYPTDTVHLGRELASLLARGLLYWKIPVSWWERQPRGNVALGYEPPTSAAVWFSKHESFFSKLIVIGCGTTCSQTQASPDSFNP